MLLMDENGRLTEAGIDWIAENHATGGQYSREDIVTIFDLNTHFYQINLSDDEIRRREQSQFRWRQAVIEQDVIALYDAEPKRYDASGDLIDATSSNAQFYANDDSIIILNRRFSTVFRYLEDLNIIPVTEASFLFGSGSTNDLRHWSVLRFLIYAIRQSNPDRFHDVQLWHKYLDAHLHYLTPWLQDPFRLLRRRQIAVATSPRTNPAGYDIRNFIEQGQDQRRDAGIENLSAKVCWYQFLLAGGRRGHGFLASGNALSNAQFQNACRRRANQGTALDSIAGVKKIADKEPDIIQILHERQLIEVLDPTFRSKTMWHNFKTEFYCAVLRAILNNGVDESDEWEVRGIDYRDPRHQSFTS